MREVRPVLAAVQLAPASVLLKTPRYWVPAYTVLGLKGLTARANTSASGRPLFATFQLIPPSVLFNRPEVVAA